MKTLAEFDSFYETHLIPDLKELDVQRKKVVRTTLLFIFLFIAAGVVFVLPFILALHPAIGAVPAFILFILAIVYIFVSSKQWKALKLAFKATVIKDIIHFIHPELHYNHARYIPESDFRNSKIFVKKPERYKGDDYVEGTLEKTDVRFSELHAEYYTRDNKGNKNYHTIFRGIFFIADFHKHFKGETFVLEDVAEKWFGSIGKMFQKMNFARPSLVKLEDVRFEKAFAVYGTDQVETRYILTPAMMERIMELKEKAKNVQLSFVDSKVYIAISVKKNLFEAPVWKSMLDRELLREYFSYLILTINIVEDLDLNTRIWSKA